MTYFGNLEPSYYANEFDEVQNLPYTGEYTSPYITENLPEGLGIYVTNRRKSFQPVYFHQGIPEKVARGWAHFYTKGQEVEFSSEAEAREFLTAMVGFFEWMGGIADALLGRNVEVIDPYHVASQQVGVIVDKHPSDDTSYLVRTREFRSAYYPLNSFKVLF
ncbi:MAG: hypothetical protein J2P36_29775 [Ktedonobacteraceae bacterium]|nr:hypothetical protein [Ktedonobacteraceae bacterium]